VGDCLLSSVGALCFTMVFRVSKLLWPSLVGFFGYFLGVFLVTFFWLLFGCFFDHFLIDFMAFAVT
jgi:preprotein translocase subunit SecE